MSMLDTGLQSTMRGPTGQQGADEARGAGWLAFAGIMVLIVAILNIIYGIAAISDSSFFVHDTKYVFSNLNTWGWVTLGIGALQLLAAFSIFNGGVFGVWFGIATAGLNAIGAMLSIPAYPFWSLAVFAVDVLIIYGLAVYGGQHRPV